MNRDKSQAYRRETPIYLTDVGTEYKYKMQLHQDRRATGLSKYIVPLGTIY